MSLNWRILTLAFLEETLWREICIDLSFKAAGSALRSSTHSDVKLICRLVTKTTKTKTSILFVIIVILINHPHRHSRQSLLTPTHRHQQQHHHRHHHYHFSKMIVWNYQRRSGGSPPMSAWTPLSSALHHLPAAQLLQLQVFWLIGVNSLLRMRTYENDVKRIRKYIRMI